MKLLTCALAAAAFWIGALYLAPEAAAQASEPMSRSVSYADLNLDNEAGARAMLRRIRHAARDVCDDTWGRTSLRQRSYVRACVREAMERAVAELDRPVVTALYQDRQPAIVAAAAETQAPVQTAEVSPKP
jgi:UrcA family protein